MTAFSSLRSAISILSAGAALCLAPAFPGSARAEAPVVRSEKPAEASRTLDLTPEWSVGGEDGDIIFGMVVATEMDEQGNLYALDSQLSCVEVFSPVGEHLRTLSGEGDGPGEVRDPQDMVRLPDGTLGLLRFVPAAVTRITLDGVPRSSFVLHPREPETGDAGDGFAVSFGLGCNGGTLVLAAYRSTPSDVGQSRRLFLSRFDTEGHETVCYRESRMELDFNAIRFIEKEFFPPFMLVHAVGPDGRVYVPAAADRYAVEVFAPDGTLEYVIERPFEPRRRTAREKGRLNALVEAWGRQVPYGIRREIEEYAPAIDDLHVDETGTLWVRHSRSGIDQPDGVLFTYDRFGPQGRWLDQVAVRADGDPRHDGIRLLGDGRALLIRGYALARWASRNARDVEFDEEDQPGNMELVNCRLEWANPGR